MFKEKKMKEKGQGEAGAVSADGMNGAVGATDKAGAVDASNPVDKAGAGGAKESSVKELTAKNAEMLNDLQRTRADFENYRKQIEAQKAQVADFARTETVRKILPLIDDFDRAIKAYPEQLGALSKNFEKTLGELKLERIAAEAGTEFDPELHNAVMMEEGEGATEVVAECLQTGYKYDGAVIKPAMVKVTTK